MKISLLRCFFLQILLLAYNLAQDVAIGGTFNTFTVTEDYDLLRIDRDCQHLAAFIMAVDEVNNKSDGINDDINTNLRISASLGQRFVQIFPPNRYFNGVSSSLVHLSDLSAQPVGIIDATNSLASAMGDAGASNNFGIMTLLTSQGSSTFKESIDYPMTLQISATVYMEAAMISNLISTKYGWNKVVIIASTSLESVDSLSTFTQVSRNKVNILGQYLINTGQTDFSKIIKEAKKTGATIFLFFLQGIETGYILEQGYNAGLFHDGTQVLVPSRAKFSKIQEALTPIGRTMEDRILKGLLLIVPNPEFYFATPKGQGFIQRFRDMKPTITRNAQGGQVCDNRTVTSGPLYTINASTTLCLGFESFSKFDQSGFDFDPRILNTYDAVHAIAKAVQMIHNEGNNTQLDGVALYKFMTSDIVISDLATGDVTFQPNAGARDKGLVFKLLNYQEGSGVRNKYSSLDTPFIGEYTDATGWVLCGDISDEAHMPSFSRQLCSTPIYRTTGDGSTRPLDHPPDITVGISHNLRVGLIVFASLGLALTLLWGCCLYTFWSVRLIRISQPKIMSIILVGAAMGLIKVLLATAKVTHANCVSQLWLSHWAFRFIFRTLMLKLWRVNEVMNAGAFKKVIIAESAVLWYLLSDVTFMTLALLVPITAVSSSENLKFDLVGLVTSEYRNQKTLQMSCQVSKSTAVLALSAILYFSDGINLVMAVYYTFLTRGVPPSVNETKTLAPAIILSIVIISVVVVVSYAVELSVDNEMLLVNAGFLVIIILGCAIYYGDKMKAIYDSRKKESGRGLSTSRIKKAVSSDVRDMKRGLESANIELKRPGGTSFSGSSIARSSEEQSLINELVLMSAILKKEPTAEKKFRKCNDKIGQWKSMLMLISDNLIESSISSGSHDAHDDVEEKGKG
mmetsp:Transcript_21262/g.20583  ORF Transcript_21262/g.20583 Transcript_21262/m.20583 type:complete len:911 (+) Transcript_21262:139-2871(+)